MNPPDGAELPTHVERNGDDLSTGLYRASVDAWLDGDAVAAYEMNQAYLHLDPRRHVDDPRQPT